MKISMKEIIIVLSVILCAAAVLALGFFIVKHFLKDTTLDGDGMVNDRCLSCKYHIGGGMEGDSLSITVKENDNETATLEVVSSSPSEEEITETYTVSFDVLEKIYQIFRKYKAEKWGNLPESELIALDAPVVSVCIKTVNTTVCFDSTKEFPKDGYSIITEIRAALYDCLEQARSAKQPSAAE